jgi:hypothetical protein
MRGRIQIAVVSTFAVAAGASSAAQQRPSAAQPSTVTITGCVQRMDESGSLGTTIPERTPTPEQAGVAANAGEPGYGFMLTDAQPATATRNARGTTGQRLRYVLIGDAAELAKYQGQRVRAQGVIAAVPTKPAESAPIGTSGSVQFQSNTARLKVTSIERVAASCK